MNEGRSREIFPLERRFLPRLPVPLPLVGAGGSFTTPGGGIPSGFRNCRECLLEFRREKSGGNRCRRKFFNVRAGKVPEVGAPPCTGTGGSRLAGRGKRLIRKR